MHTLNCNLKNCFAPICLIGCELISKKMGRPLKGDNPKAVSLHLRISSDEAELIKNCSEQLGISRTDMILRAVKLLANQIEIKE